MFEAPIYLCNATNMYLTGLIKIIELELELETIQRTINAIQNFTDPFTVEASKLVSLASGATMPPDIEKDVQRAERAGKEEKDLFIQDRLVEKKKSFLIPIHQLKLKKMA